MIEVADPTLIVTNDGEIPFRRPQSGIDPVGAQDFVTKGWAIANLGGPGGADPYPVYSLVDGTRAFTGVVAGVDPTLNAHLATKFYVDVAVFNLSVTAVTLFQPKNQILTNLSSFLPSTANTITYFTDTVGGLATTPLTTAGRNIIGQATEAAVFDLIAPDPGGSVGVIATTGGSWAFADLHSIADGDLLVWDSANNGVNYLTPGTLAFLNTINNSNWSGTVLSVPNGGSGRNTATTAYGLLAAGTTATGVHQTLAAGLTTQILVGGGASALPVWTTATGSGAPVRATSPALTTPNIGTPSAGVLTNCTGLPTAGLVNSAVTNAKLAQMAATRIKARITASTGDPEDATPTQFAQAMGFPLVLGSEAGDPLRTVGASSTAEQTLSSLTIAKNTMGATSIAILEVFGQMLQNWAGTNHGTIRVKLGSTTVYQKALDATQSAIKRPFRIRVVIVAKNNTAKQYVNVDIAYGAAYTPTTGLGDFGFASGACHTVNGSATEDTVSTNLDVAVTNQWDTSDASSYYEVYAAKLWMLP